jgi:hypothetical protein
MSLREAQRRSNPAHDAAVRDRDCFGVARLAVTGRPRRCSPRNAADTVLPHDGLEPHIHAKLQALQAG